MEEEKKRAWSDDAEAVFIATSASILELSSYGEKMNIIINLVRVITMAETFKTIAKELGDIPPPAAFETQVLITGMRVLCNDAADKLRGIPGKTKDMLHSLAGCGECDICKAAARSVNKEDVLIRPSKPSRDAIEQLIATMGGPTKQ